jgi:hypothetical protein
MIGLAVAPEVLLWADRSATLREPIQADYRLLISESFRRLCRSMRADGLGDATRELAQSVPSECFDRVVLAPRSARRLLWPRDGESSSTLRFLHNALLCERAILGLDPFGPILGWTADCRAYVQARGAIVTQPQMASRIALDLRSAHARSLDLMGGSRLARKTRAAPTPEVASRTGARLEEAWQRVASKGETTSDCVIAWTRVIVPQVDPSGLFWSGTNGEYIGRVVLVNVDQERVSVEEIADALVHEAIHGFLYMHESVEPWVLDFALYTDEGSLVSPWSGTMLPVRPFMQACFVWYGLAMFWAQHVNDVVFDKERVHYLLGRALSGFRGDTLVDLLAPLRSRLHPEMLEIIDSMQRTIRSLLA